MDRHYGVSLLARRVRMPREGEKEAQRGRERPRKDNARVAGRGMRDGDGS